MGRINRSLSWIRPLIISVTGVPFIKVRVQMPKLAGIEMGEWIVRNCPIFRIRYRVATLICGDTSGHHFSYFRDQFIGQSQCFRRLLK